MKEAMEEKMKTSSEKGITGKKEATHKKEVMLDLDLKKLITTHYTTLLLTIFIVLGFYLRSYHMDYPPIGYHNMKENQYLPYTQFMYNADEFLDYFRTETYWGGSREKGYFTQYELPILSWFILPGWKVFGIQLWFARLIVILFSLACIPLIYAITKQLTRHKHQKHQEFLALTSSLLFAIMPLAVFFGRNVQPETPALTAILLYTLFFLQWREKYLSNKQHIKTFFFFSAFTLIAILFKVPNGIGLVPLLFFVPYKRLLKDKKTTIQLAAIFIVILMLFPIWTTGSKKIMPDAQTVGTASFSDSFSEVKSNILYVFSGKYLQESKEPLKYFAKDNYTWLFFWVAALGVCFAGVGWYHAKKKEHEHTSLYILGSVVSMGVYILAFATKTKGHSYYQVPFLFFVCLASTYAFVYVGTWANSIVVKSKEKEIRIKHAEYVLLAIALILSYPSLKQSISVQFDTQFIGEDVAGNFIKENSKPDERVFLAGAGSQNVGMLWNAERYGTQDYLDNLTKIQELENALNFRWFFIYKDGMAFIQQHSDVWEYVQKNYKIRQVGGLLNNNNFEVIYLILERGGTFKPEEFQSIPPVKAATYEFTSKNVDFYTINK